MTTINSDNLDANVSATCETLKSSRKRRTTRNMFSTLLGDFPYSSRNKYNNHNDDKEDETSSSTQSDCFVNSKENQKESQDFVSSRSSFSCLKIRTQSESLQRRYLKRDRTTCNNATPGKKACFSTAETRVYPIILSDHPGTIGGPPIGLDWDPIKISMETVDAYCRHQQEDAYQNFHTRYSPFCSSTSKEYLTALFLPQTVREHWLLKKKNQNQTYGHPDIRRAEQEAAKIRTSRQKNANPSTIVSLVDNTTLLLSSPHRYRPLRTMFATNYNSSRGRSR